MPASTRRHQPKLLDETQQVLRLRYYSIHIARSYLDWIVRFVRCHHMRSRQDLCPAELHANPETLIRFFIHF
jgi:hypothetical protein